MSGKIQKLWLSNLEGGNDMLVGSTGLAGFIALTGFILLLFLYDRYVSKERIMGNTVTLERTEYKSS